MPTDQPSSNKEESKEIFSFHLVQLSLFSMLKYFFRPLHKRNIAGLRHSESFFVMNLGEGVLSTKRFSLGSFAFFMWWNEEQNIDEMMEQSQFNFFKDKGWQVRMRKYRRWGGVQEINDAHIDPKLRDLEKPVVAVTLARLKLSQTLRFTKWGKPVEKQVRDHKGHSLALAAFRPFNHFCTFSIWKNETEMTNMVFGKKKEADGDEHKLAMRERARKAFHSEFATMRFIPTKQVGSWEGKSDYITEVTHGFERCSYHKGISFGQIDSGIVGFIEDFGLKGVTAF